MIVVIIKVVAAAWLLFVGFDTFVGRPFGYVNIFPHRYRAEPQPQPQCVAITLTSPIGGSNIVTTDPSGATFTEKVPLTREITVTLP